MLYKIIRIQHTGSCGDIGTDRTDGEYPKRIGRIVDLNPDDISVYLPLLLRYVKDVDGSDYSHRCLCTSRVRSVEDYGNELVVTTWNSIFTFRRL